MQLARTWGRSAKSKSSWLPISRYKFTSNVRHASSVPQNLQKSRGQSRVQGNGSRNPRRDGGRHTRSENESSRPMPSIDQTMRSLHNDRDIIDPLSLENTLRAHQQANQESIIIRHTNAAPSDKHGRKAWGPSQSAALHLDIEREDPQEGRGQWEDYTAKPRALSFDWQIIGDISTNLKTPWMSVLESQLNPGTSAAARLSEEIRAADLYFTPSQEEWAAVNSVTKQLEQIVLDVSPLHMKLDVIGSRASGLATPLSDLDLNLVVSGTDPTTEPPHSQQVEILGNLFKVMKWGQPTPTFSTSFFAARARVPIIVGTHSSGLEFQIQSASSCYGSLEVVRHLCAEYPTIRALFKIIKQLLKMRGLSDGALGGLTSYPLMNMITVSLKRSIRTTNAFDFGAHLVQFLEYWSTINTYTTGVTHLPSSFVKPPVLESNSESDTTPFSEPETRPASHPFIDQESSLDAIRLITSDPVGAHPLEFDVRRSLPLIHEPQDNFMLTLHDPANPYNDLGRSAYAIKHVQATFAKCLKLLRRDMEGWDAKVRRGEDFGKGIGGNVSLLAGLIGGDYSLYNLERKRVTARRDVEEPERMW